MKTTIVVSALGLLSMVLVLGYGFIYGDFFKDGGVILSNPWGIVSLVDLYVGFFLFVLFIFHKRKHWLERLFWFVMMMVFGFFTGALFVLIEAIKSKGSKEAFFKEAL